MLFATDDPQTSDDTDNNWENIFQTEYITAFVTLQAIGFVVFSFFAYYTLKDHFRIMQGIMKKLVQCYFWTKLIILILMFIMIGCERRDISDS